MKVTPVSPRADAARRWMVLTGIGFALIVAWPLVDRMAIACDDVGRMLQLRLFADPVRIVDSWRESLFRPLLALSAQLIDPETREGPGVALLQGATLAIALAAVVVLASHELGNSRSAFVAATLFLLHPATSVSSWQMDTVSQTASAACGLWLTALGAGALRPNRPILAWAAITLLGLLSKENFLGWLPVAALLQWRRTGGLASGPRLALIAGALYVMGRIIVLGSNALALPGGRYTLHVGPNVVENALLLSVGGLGFGPIHALRSLGPGDIGFWVAAAGLLVPIAIGLLTLRESPTSFRTAITTAALAVLANAPVLPLGHVAELYLMGPNGLCALALASCLQTLHQSDRHRASTALLAVLLICGAVGLASRAYHFGLTWNYSRTLAQRVAVFDGRPKALGPRVPCNFAGRSHSVYIVSPLAALNVPATAWWYTATRGSALPADWDQRIDCRGLPTRARW